MVIVLALLLSISTLVEHKENQTEHKIYDMCLLWVETLDLLSEQISVHYICYLCVSYGLRL